VYHLSGASHDEKQDCSRCWDDPLASASISNVSHERCEFLQYNRQLLPTLKEFKISEMKDAHESFSNRTRCNHYDGAIVKKGVSDLALG